MNEISTVNLNTVYPTGISKKEHKYINKTFCDCSKSSHQKETSRRNDDAGYEAALKCLSRQFVTDGPEQAKFTAAKMAFIQKMMNDNISQDADLSTQKNSDHICLIGAKADAKAKVIPVKTAFVETTGKVISDNLSVADDIIGKAVNVIV